MSIELAKAKFVELKKKATESIELAGLRGQRAKVVLALDISGSMSSLFSNGTVQDVVEKLLALGSKFDNNNAIDVFLFGEYAHDVGELNEDEFYNYVNEKIKPMYPLEGGTNYAEVMQLIVDKFSGSDTTKKGLFGRLFGADNSQLDEPVFVIFITDGDNYDKSKSEKVIKEASNKGIFWQFVGIGNASFDFLQRLDEMGGRYIDNANFFQLNDIRSVSDEEIYRRLLNEFPTWLKQAKNKNLIKG